MDSGSQNTGGKDRRRYQNSGAVTPAVFAAGVFVPSVFGSSGEECAALRSEQAYRASADSRSSSANPITSSIELT